MEKEGKSKMTPKTNCKRGNKDYYRIRRKIGMKPGGDGIWLPVYKEFYGKSLKDAEDKYDAYLKAHGQKLNDAIDKPLGEVADEWLENFFKHSNYAESTKKLYEDNYRRFLRMSPVGQTLLRDVTSMTIQNYYNTCGLKYSNLKPIHCFLKHFYKYCALTGICNDVTGPLTVPKKPKKDRLEHEIEVWDDDDLRKAINALSGTKLRFLVVLAVNSGARFSELLALEYSDINGNELTINKQITDVAYNGKVGARLSDTKTPTSNRKIPLSDEVILELGKHEAIHQAEMLRKGYRTNYIFSTNTGNYPNHTSISRQLKKVYIKAGVPLHTFHSFRHTFATNLSRAGVPIEQTAKLLGHSDIKVTEKYYLAVSNEEKLDAVNKIVKFSLG